MLEFGFKSDKGKIRSINQDSYFVMPKEGIFIIADGVGGHKFGELASRTTVTDIASFVKDDPIPEDADADYFRNYFLELVFLVNDHIYSMDKDHSAGGMATTLVLLYIRGDNAYIVNVGDSRAYLVRDGNMMQITEDHTYVNDLLRKNIITEEEAANHPDRNIITRAIGAGDEVTPDFFTFRIYENDVILMCTDGLYNEVPEEHMCEMITESDNMRDLCADLVDIANENGGRDNITVVAVKL